MWLPFDQRLLFPETANPVTQDGDEGLRRAREKQAWAEAEKWRNGLPRELAERLFRRRMTLVEAASDLNLNAEDNQFKRLVRSVVQKLRDALNPPGEERPDLSPGRSKAKEAKRMAKQYVDSALADLQRDELEACRAEISTWPNNEIHGLAEQLLTDSGLVDQLERQVAGAAGFADLARQRKQEPYSAEFRRLLLEAVLRLALRPKRLMKLVEVGEAIACWPEDEDRRAAGQLFFPGEVATRDGQPEADSEERVVRRLAECLAVRLPGAPDPAPGERP